MGGRMLPVECEHGVVLDWGDFGPNPDDSQQGLATCERCEADEYRIAIRPHEADEDWCDDIVVNDVSMFRMEQMDRRVWWACCYLAGEDEGNRIAFDIRYVPKEKEVVVTVSERPQGVKYEHPEGCDAQCPPFDHEHDAPAKDNPEAWARFCRTEGPEDVVDNERHSCGLPAGPHDTHKCACDAEWPAAPDTEEAAQ